MIIVITSATNLNCTSNHTKRDVSIHSRTPDFVCCCVCVVDAEEEEEEEEEFEETRNTRKSNSESEIEASKEGEIQEE